MSDFSKESVPPIGRDASVEDPKTGESTGPTRSVKAWRWVSRGFLTLVLVLGFSEVFLFRGAFFRLATPAVKANAQEPNKAGGEGPQKAEQPEFNPSDLNSVNQEGLITPLDVSDQQQLALKLQELSDKVEALEARERKIRERALNLGQTDIRDAMWRRLVRGTLKDSDAARQWCEGTNTDWRPASPLEAAVMNYMGYGIAEPLDTVKGRILCGNASTFDASYLYHLETWTRNRSAELDKWHDRLNALSARLKKEGVLQP